jgi:LmbE family N-acetylglucosaminyl deacetylase
MFKSNDKILVVAAHPDDEVIGCGGTILKAIELGCSVSVIFLGEGVSARYPGKELSKETLRARNIRENECKKSLKVLGIKDYQFGSLLCARFDVYPLIEIVRTIEKKINSFKPTIIFTHNVNEVNVDHGLTYKAVEIATRPFKKNFLRSIYSFEIVCSGNFVYTNNFSPNVYVDIKKFWKKKILAFKSYKNEIRKYPFPRSIKGLEIQARYRGLQSGHELSEAFKLERFFY